MFAAGRNGPAAGTVAQRSMDAPETAIAEPDTSGTLAPTDLLVVVGDLVYPDEKATSSIDGALFGLSACNVLSAHSG